MRTLARFFASAVALIFVGGLFAPGVKAHPTASSFVEIMLLERRLVEVRVTTDAKALLLKLQARASVAATDRDGTETDRIRALAPALVAALNLSSDIAPIDLTFEGSSSVKERAGLVQIALSGRIPVSARHLVWKTSLFIGSYPLSVRRGNSAITTDQTDNYEWLNGSDASAAYDLEQLAGSTNRWHRLARLVATGFTHIVPSGLDHMLFVLGLFLLARGTRALLLQITAFTLAHSATLALAVSGLVTVPSAVVEPLIAASIVYVAIENVVASRLSRWRLAVVFGFGLMHGLGFAGALADLGIDGGHLTETLVGFNLGVELGQLAVVGAAALLLRALPVSADRRRTFVTVPASIAIAATGCFWAVERIIG